MGEKNEPAAHGTQIFCPAAAWNCPAGHKLHWIAPLALNLPAGQMPLHSLVVLSAVPYCPLGHTVQAKPCTPLTTTSCE